jgi:hypothetical protein
MRRAGSGIQMMPYSFRTLAHPLTPTQRSSVCLREAAPDNGPRNEWKHPARCRPFLLAVVPVELAFRYGQRVRLDQQTLSFIAAPGLAEAYHNGMPRTLRPHPAREQRIPGPPKIQDRRGLTRSSSFFRSCGCMCVLLTPAGISSDRDPE